MSYELAFLDAALKEWRKLDSNTRDQFKSKIEERLANPRVPAAKLSGGKDRYKIKLRSSGYRLVYEVRDAQLVVVVVAVGKRERDAVYRAAEKR
ncbi:type II toxin-antitoxin system RelE/ParE family toxin [Bradyrhizobium sp. LA7.1]|uniref:type II toxin-antitoxin system RelE family toxin n=1 Tax=Bradyrhizobium sp. LA7.1 TaxID=3156324 RepID=UPI003396C72D